MSAAEPPQGVNSAPAGGSAAAKPQAWGDHASAAEPPQGANSAPAGGSAAAKPQAWGDHASEQLILDFARAEPPTFANFVAGVNREALAALAALAGGTSRETGILLWGGPGAGKSHLLRATALAAEKTMRPVIHCGTPRDVPAADELPASTLLVVDAVDAATASDQARLFTRVNWLAATGGRWLVAAAAPPARLPLREDLRTRLALGLVLEIVPLADEDKAAALAAYARERGFRLSDDVVGYLLAHGRRDMTSLVATLAALDRHSLATQRSITVPLLREWVQRDLRLAR